MPFDITPLLIIRHYFPFIDAAIMPPLIEIIDIDAIDS
jgi:hypothetical protein